MGVAHPRPVIIRSKVNLDVIKKVFEKLDIEESQQVTDLMNGNLDTLPLCPFGIIDYKFIEKDKLMFEKLIPEIQSLLENESFQKWIVQLEKNKAKEELKAIINKLETTNYNDAEKQMDKVKNLSFEKFVSNCKDLFNSLLDIYKDDLEFYRENYTSVCVAKILFEDYKRDKARKNRFKIPKNNKLEKLYQDNDIDLNSIDAQYNKYKLLTIDSNFEISINNIPKVYDKR